MANKTTKELPSPGSPPAVDVGSPLDKQRSPEEELLDWDAALEAPPRRPGGRIKVSLKYAGRSKPIEPDESWE
jgi:hypothetical protein